MSTVSEERATVVVFKRDDPRLCPGANFELLAVEAQADGRNLTRASFHGARIINVSARGTKLVEADFREATIEQADFRRANLTGARDLHTVHGLQNVLFDDNTILDEIDFASIGILYPHEARKLRQIHYVGRLKRKRPILYWLWQLSCGCGRSWRRLLVWGLLWVVLLGSLYVLGDAYPQCAWLPHLQHPGSPSSLADSLWYGFEFSAMTFVGFNMANAGWNDRYTGTWVAVQAWSGLAFIGVFITVIATNMARNE